ncbi:MAG: tail protein X [Pseudomonadota bacterium]
MASAASRLIARDGDTLDDLLWRERALGPDALASVLAINPGLAALGAVLTAGTSVVLPALPRSNAPPVLEIVQLWT